jgi:membrane-associated protease RseP (regulator of RpoE activity)
MPLYVLDGGQAIAVTYSALTKKAIKPLAEQLLTKLSFIVLIGIGFIAIYNDLAAIKG